MLYKHPILSWLVGFNLVLFSSGSMASASTTICTQADLTKNSLAMDTLDCLAFIGKSIPYGVAPTISQLDAVCLYDKCKSTVASAQPIFTCLVPTAPNMKIQDLVDYLKVACDEKAVQMAATMAAEALATTKIPNEVENKVAILHMTPPQHHEDDQPIDEELDVSADVKDEKQPTDQPTVQPTDKPTDQPTDQPTDKPTDKPTDQPTDKPTDKPTDQVDAGPDSNKMDQTAKDAGLADDDFEELSKTSSFNFKAVSAAGSTMRTTLSAITASFMLLWISLQA